MAMHETEAVAGDGRSRRERSRAAQMRGELERHRSRRVSDDELLRAFGWVGVTLGLLGVFSPRRLARLAGLGRRRRALRRSRTIAIAASASGATILALMGGRKRPRLAGAGIIDVERTITSQRPAGELFQAMREPRTLQRIMGHFADVRATGDSRLHWTLPLARRSLEWDMQLVDEHPGELLRWQSVAGASVRSDVSACFRRAPHDWGTEIALRVRIDPGTALLRSVAGLLGGTIPGLFVAKALRRFKSLVETGELPTTHGQPAARNSGRDR